MSTGWSLSAHYLFFKGEFIWNTDLFTTIFMARLSLLCHFVEVSKNSTKQALSNLEPLYKCIKLTGKKKIWHNLSVKSNKQLTNQ